MRDVLILEFGGVAVEHLSVMRALTAKAEPDLGPVARLQETLEYMPHCGHIYLHTRAGAVPLLLPLSIFSRDPVTNLRKTVGILSGFLLTFAAAAPHEAR